ncbi:YhcH/YjgK/YiaL family protein [Prevotella sp. tc2-28]|jgi:YhcH/YjgK/YiaL family protein|uniref:YhcH/YjgK/YiaL family protein n=1 Tax=Prevotella sp. tc2-28 TaxID=1761888 RepID=UPI0008984002|nr:YhcH/YjgK/YiaL family protein [Prevotella sp. tc2-28]SEA88484.1 YhcH/YjgK/YiaL family protein [Prevotella sp. tc2-28]
MIIDKLENLKMYESVNPLFAKVVEFLQQNDLNALEAGKHEIVGKDLFVNIQMAKGKTPDEAVIETHDKMIDIQIPLTAAETFGYTQRDQLPKAEYNAEKDITKIPNLAADSYVTCQPGMMAIFFPQDGHAPCIAGVPELKKAIFKVKA